MENSGIVLTLLMDYFNSSDTEVEEIVANNIIKEINKYIKEINELIKRKKHVRAGGSVRRVNSCVNKLCSYIGINSKKGQESSDKRLKGYTLVKKLETLKTALESSESIVSSEIKNIKECFIKIENTDVIGISDNTIIRMKAGKESAWKRENNLNIICYYWFIPTLDEYEDFNTSFIPFVRQKDVDQQLYKLLEDFFDDQDKKIEACHFMELFRKVKRFSNRFTQNSLSDEEVLDYIRNELGVAINNEEPEPKGLSSYELSNIINTLAIQLREELKVYCGKAISIENAIYKNNYKALIRYRLYNYFYNKADINANFRVIAFKIFQKEFIGNICIHPAAQIDKDVYISENILIGKQCHIKSKTVLGKNIYLYPFRLEANTDKEKYIVIGNGCIIDSRIVGVVEVGDKSCVKYQGIISEDIPSNSYLLGSDPIKFWKDEKEYSEIFNKMKESILCTIL